MQQTKDTTQHLNKDQTNIKVVLRKPDGYDVAVYRPRSALHDNLLTNG